MSGVVPVLSCCQRSLKFPRVSLLNLYFYCKISSNRRIILKKEPREDSQMIPGLVVTPFKLELCVPNVCFFFLSWIDVSIMCVSSCLLL